MERKFCFLALIGLPGSGKTTFAKALKTNLSDAHVIHVCYDELVPLDRQKEMAESSSSEWRQTRKEIVDSVDALIAGGDGEAPFLKQLGEIPSDAKHVLVVLDDNNYYRSMRYDLVQIARRREVGFCQLYFQLGLEDAKGLNKLRPEGERLPDEVLETMSSRMEAPDPLANSWEAFSFSVAAFDGRVGKRTEPPLEMCKTIVDLAFDNPLKEQPDTTEERDKSRVACSASIVHQADKLLRKSVGARVKSTQMASEGGASADSLRATGKSLNEARSEVLEDLKTGFTRLPREIVRAVEAKKEKKKKKEEEKDGESEVDGLKELETLVEELFDLKLEEMKKREEPSQK